MYFFLESAKNIYRYKNRYFLIAIFLYIISFVCSTSSNILNIYKIAEKEIKLKINDNIDNMIELLEFTNLLNTRVQILNVAIIIVIFIGILVINYSITINIIERQHDIGILQSMGMSRIKIMLGFLIEFFILFFSLTATGIITSLIVTLNAIKYLDPSFLIILEHIDINLMMNIDLLQISLFSIAVIIIPVLIIMIFILRYSPLSMLFNKN